VPILCVRFLVTITRQDVYVGRLERERVRSRDKRLRPHSVVSGYTETPIFFRRTRDIIWTIFPTGIPTDNFSLSFSGTRATRKGEGHRHGSDDYRRAHDERSTTGPCGADFSSGLGAGASRQHRDIPSRAVMNVSGIPDIYSIYIRVVGPWMNKFTSTTDVNREKPEGHGFGTLPSC
jgi:hypothetical protein